ncbi:MAG: 3-hydroxyacyl-CoA dehydrogenase family protein [Thermoanaerobaculia bacterium]|nr:3-hydroxyacyl-CoA dehydrogenase family protein [Thermoanaerobaculia bacterium]
MHEIGTLCVTGAGQMGSQIAMLGALAGIETRLHDISEEQLERALQENRKHVGRRVEKGRMTAEAMEAAFDRLRPTARLEEAARGADFVIEAVVERLEVKRQVFAELDRVCPPHAVLATNSSYLMSSEIADATGRPDKVCNMHFFFPPLVMKLVEVVRGEATSEATVKAAAALARRLGKEPVMLHKELPGFLVNRILRAISNEAYHLLESGVASFEDIDRAARLGLNHPLGPFQLADFSGLDIGYNARLEIFERTRRPEDRPPEALARRVERGDLGRKTGRGFYDYTTDPPTPTEE